VSRRPGLVVVSNDLPDSRYGAERLAVAFGGLFDVRITDPTPGFGDAAGWFGSERPDAIVLSRTDRSVTDDLPWMREEQAIVRLAAARGTPLLGVCFGHQMIGAAFGGRLVRREKRVGIFEVEVTGDDPLLGREGSVLRAPEQHAEHLDGVPEGFILLARSPWCRVEAMRHATAPLYGVQFHPCYTSDVIDEDEAWSSFEPSAFRHDGSALLARAARRFAALVGA